MAQLTANVLRRSKGAKISKGDTLLVWYEGTFAESGERFDANYDFTTFSVPTITPNYTQLDGSFVLQAGPSSPFEFVVGAGAVISGWDQTFAKGRRLGEVIDLTVPFDLAYGEEGNPPTIPPKSDLRFKVEVIGLLPKAKEVASFPELKDFGVDAKKLGLNSKALDQVQNMKVGLDGRDRLIGDNTKDFLIGLGGNDALLGAGGADVLIGSGGRNRYVYTDINDSPAGKDKRDSIYGFGKNDTINLRALDGELSFIGGKKFSGAAGDVRFSKGVLGLDLDGDGSEDFSIALPGTKALKGSNLLL